jgi:hypothetical protein
MKTRNAWGAALTLLALAALPRMVAAQSTEQVVPNDPDERVYRYDLAGPRLGATFAPSGDAITQFGWHFESQAGPSRRGPWFIVERVFLFGGLENNRMIPNGTLIFGMRLPSSFEFGVGPSVTLFGPRGLNSGIVAAVGHSFRAGGIRVPVNLAVASERGGEVRWTLVTGWAIRDRVGQPAPAADWRERGSGRSGI